MRRYILMLMLAAIMTAMMAASALPAQADEPSGEQCDNWYLYCYSTGGGGGGPLPTVHTYDSWRPGADQHPRVHYQA